MNRCCDMTVEMYEEAVKVLRSHKETSNYIVCGSNQLTRGRLARGIKGALKSLIDSTLTVEDSGCCLPGLVFEKRTHAYHG